MTKREAEELKKRVELMTTFVHANSGIELKAQYDVFSVIDSMTDADKPDPRLEMLDEISKRLEYRYHEIDRDDVDVDWRDGFMESLTYVARDLSDIRHKIQEESE